MKAELKKLIREVIEEVVEEMTTSGAAGPYSTPNAFQGGASDAKRKKKIAVRSMPGGKVVGEEITDDVDIENPSIITRSLEEGKGRYYNFRESNVMKSHSKVSLGIREAKKIIREVEFLVGICERLKLETGVDQSQLWKRSAQDIQEIHSRLKNIAKKINRVGK